MKLIYFVFCFSLTPLVYAQMAAYQEISELTLSNEASTLLNQVEKKELFHDGALLVLDLNMDARKLKSTFCLSCHDGFFAPEGHTTTNIGNPSSIEHASVLRFNHPVAFEFTRELAAANHYLNDPYDTASGNGGTIAQDLLIDGRIECITCHNIYYELGETQKYSKLNKSNGQSDLCLTCHNR